MSNERSVLSIIGPHAGEGVYEMLDRKTADIKRAGKTLWLYSSSAAPPERVQKFFREYNDEVWVAFYPAADKNGACPTKSADAMTEMSLDRINWQPLPQGISPVTGRRNSYALIVRSLTVYGIVPPDDLWQYAQGESDSPVRFRQGASTVLARKQDTSNHPERMRSHVRLAVASGRLEKPYAVWVR